MDWVVTFYDRSVVVLDSLDAPQAFGVVLVISVWLKRDNTLLRRTIRTVCELATTQKCSGIIVLHTALSSFTRCAPQRPAWSAAPHGSVPPSPNMPPEVAALIETENVPKSSPYSCIIA